MEQNKLINIELSERELGWLIEALEYYVEEAEAAEDDKTCTDFI